MLGRFLALRRHKHQRRHPANGCDPHLMQRLRVKHYHCVILRARGAKKFAAR
jgi:hypothetical protein